MKDKDKHKRHRSGDIESSNPDRILEDLRSRLLDKRNRHKVQSHDEYRRPTKGSSQHDLDHDDKRHKNYSRDLEEHRRQRDKPAEYYERKSKKEIDIKSRDLENEDYRSERKRNSEGESEHNYEQKRDKTEMETYRHKEKTNLVRDVEYDERRDRLLVAEREMLRLKKISRMELLARRELKSKKLLEHEEASSRKKMRRSSQDSLDKDSKDVTVVMVSDDTEEEMANSNYDSDHSKSDDSEEEASENTDDHSDEKRKSNSRSRSCSESDTSSESNDESHTEIQKDDDDIQMEDSEKKIENTKTENETNSPNTNNIANNNAEHEKNSEAEDLTKFPPYYPGIQGCRSVAEFQCLNRIEEGTYGVVYRAKDLRTGEVVALKRLKMEKEKEGFPITSLREINTLLKAQHPNIVTVREIVVGSNMDKIFIVMDYVEHDLKSLMETMKQGFLPGEVKCLVQQLLKAVAHLHDNWILHRDLKTSNLLLSHKGILKVGDFGTYNLRILEIKIRFFAEEIIPLK
ncbi:serine/threonine-protein kinase PITSLRE-like [Ctenocephalides felis]|uniref:serine/threonine-protein kinase PITSLRE-like n=1 Tax=Ctenocephalides felis TaxID=7515 RepID=UPI000E6E32F2|nr:serine/threonine-protein kinase PITSLRE-like [Ctenocephalides felis]